MLKVPIRAINGLLSMGEPFVLYLFSTDSVSQLFTNTFRHFLKFETIDCLVLATEVNEETAVDLSASIVPQLRFFKRGREYTRAHGSFDYDGLNRFFNGLR